MRWCGSQRRPIATHFLKGEFERRGVTASYHLDRIGFRTQQVSNLVIGDPKRPDLVAQRAMIQMRLKWDGSFEVYRVVARGVRLRGRLVHGKVSWGQIDKLLPPPSNKPFALPDFVLDIADSSISLATPFGPVGLALEGNGQLTGGFKGHVALSSPRLVPGTCAAKDLRANARGRGGCQASAGRGAGDARAASSCPASRFDVVAPRFDAKASFNEVVHQRRRQRADGDQRRWSPAPTASPISSATSLTRARSSDGRRRVKLAAQRSRLATIYADRTRLDGRLSPRHSQRHVQPGGRLRGRQCEARSVDAGRRDASRSRQRARPRSGPIAASIGNAIGRTASNFNAGGQIRVVNFPGGGAARITDADIVGPAGARARVLGGSGVTYYWPSGGLRIDGNIEMARRRTAERPSVAYASRAPARR